MSGFDIAQIASADNLTLWCDYLGTFAFAISGTRLAAAKGFDWFGAYVAGVVTAVGGGTLRDLLIGVRPFWLTQPSYLLVTALALVFTIVLRRYIVRINSTLFFFDAVGLGLFTVVGMTKTLEMGYAWWLAVIMGTITGAFGGMIRDVLINEVPLIFRKDFYAVACLTGGLVYIVLLRYTSLSVSLSQLLCAVSVIGLRIMALLFGLGIPTFKPEDERS